jgi:cytochrome c-type biogenesis protein CcmH
MKKLLIFVFLTTALGLAAASAGAAPVEQVPTPTMNEINQIARDLWCPLCNGVRLDNCDLQACVQMREVISQKMVEGESKEQIKAYFVQQYGDVVLGQPSREGFNLVVWIFPILAAVVGLGWVVYLVLTWQKRRPAIAAGSSPGSPVSSPADDDYARRVDRELNQLD